MGCFLIDEIAFPIPESFLSGHVAPLPEQAVIPGVVPRNDKS